MITVDSFAFHFRHDWDDMSNRTRVMNSLAQQFMKIACNNNSAVSLVFINSYSDELIPPSSPVQAVLDCVCQSDDH